MRRFKTKISEIQLQLRKDFKIFLSISSSPKVNGYKFKFCHTLSDQADIDQHRVSAFLIPSSRQDLWVFEVTDRLKLQSEGGTFCTGADPNFFQHTSKPSINVPELLRQKYPPHLNAQRQKHAFSKALCQGANCLTSQLEAGPSCEQ